MWKAATLCLPKWDPSRPLDLYSQTHAGISLLTFLGSLLYFLVSVSSVVFDSLHPHGLKPTRVLCPRTFPGKSTGVGCHFFLQGIFPTQGLNSHLFCFLHWKVDSLPKVSCILGLCFYCLCSRLRLFTLLFSSSHVSVSLFKVAESLGQ